MQPLISSDKQESTSGKSPDLQTSQPSGKAKEMYDLTMQYAAKQEDPRLKRYLENVARDLLTADWEED